MPQDPPVQPHALIVADGVDGAEALRSGQLSPSKDLRCRRQDANCQSCVMSSRGGDRVVNTKAAGGGYIYSDVGGRGEAALSTGSMCK